MNCHKEIHCEHAYDDRARRFKKRLLELKGVDCCERCSYRGKTLGSLDFHHVRGDKKFVFGDVVSRNMEIPWDQVLMELDKCQVLCSNCHQLEHLDLDRYEQFLDRIKHTALKYKEKQPKVDRRLVVKMRGEGMTYREIVRKIPCSVGTVALALKVAR